MLGYGAPAEDAEVIPGRFAPWRGNVDRGNVDRGNVGRGHVDTQPLAAARALVGRDAPTTACKDLHIHISLDSGAPPSSHGDRPETG